MNGSIKPSKPILCVVTDWRLAGGEHNLLATVQAALAGGFNMVMLREKWLDEKRLLQLAYKLRGITLGRAKLVINGNFNIAVQVGADGLHYHAGAQVEKSGGMLIGQSVHSLTELKQRATDGQIDYACLGPIFRTLSHPDTPPLGTEALLQAALCAPSIDLVAIGGINKINAKSAMRGGAAGIATIRAIIEAPDPQKAAREIAMAVGVQS